MLLLYSSMKGTFEESVLQAPDEAPRHVVARLGDAPRQELQDLLHERLDARAVDGPRSLS